MELAAACRWIRDLETELVVTQRANELWSVLATGQWARRLIVVCPPSLAGLPRRSGPLGVVGSHGLAGAWILDDHVDLMTCDAPDAAF